LKEKAVFDAYDSEAKTPLVVPRVKGPMSDKKGTYTLTLESWSPWMEGDPKLDFSKSCMRLDSPSAASIVCGMSHSIPYAPKGRTKS
jgi:hypothetical protein